MADDSLAHFDTRCRSAHCRACGAVGLRGVLDLGMMPLADGLLTSAQLASQEQRYPLELAFCEACSLVQIIETVPPEVLFGADYPYYSSFSDSLLAHSRANAMDLIQRRNLKSDSFVVEVASNDGYLLKNFVEAGIPVLGIDPAPGPAKAAIKAGVPTLIDFFGPQLACKLRDGGKRADVILANNVFAHVADTNGFVSSLATVLKDDGVAVIEVPYLRNLVENCEFDTIYHEHLCYFSLTAVDRLTRRHGLYLNDVRRLPIHGGSVRLYLERRENVQASVLNMLNEERRLGMDRFEYYSNFGRRVQRLRDELRQLLSQLKTRGHSVAAYGAAAKGAVLLNYIDVGGETIDFVVDRNTHKQGKFMPGVHIAICEPEQILRSQPDYVLMLPWNFKDEILRQNTAYRQRGGLFIVPIPSPAVM